MKIARRILPILSINVLATMPILYSSSCSCYSELNLNEQQQYIYDRTFSIMCRKNNSCSFGTGWIISDATETNPNDYTYWMATNWHVIHGFTTLASQDYYYADQSLATYNPYVNYSDYKKFNRFNIEDTNKFTYSDSKSTRWTSCIDMSVVKVDFGAPSGKILQKLDKLNELQKQNGYINKFAKHNDETKNKNKIIGGYPMKKGTGFGGQWETHSFAGSVLEYCQKYSKYDGKNYGHALGEPYYNQDGSWRPDGKENFNYWDVSPQYWFKQYVDKGYMDGGASGSMMITEDYEVCGIYWGGWNINNKYYPSFSLFNTDEINFIEDYIIPINK